MEDETIEVYRFYDKDGNLLYVGQTAWFEERRRSHQLTKTWADEIDNVTIEEFPTRAKALKAEAKAISTENPKYNYAGKHTKLIQNLVPTGPELLTILEKVEIELEEVLKLLAFMCEEAGGVVPWSSSNKIHHGYVYAVLRLGLCPSPRLLKAMKVKYMMRWEKIDDAA